MSVCAAVLREPEDGADALQALERQTRPPRDAVVVDPGGDLRAALERRTEWIWLVDGSVVPEPDALERLLDGADRLRDLPEPVLLTSKVVNPDGSLDEASLPVVYTFDLNFAVAAIDRRLLSIRIARRGSLLVRRYAVEADPRPPDRGDLAWSMRLMNRQPGVLVPSSVAVRRRPVQPPPEAANILRLLASGATWPPDRPWFVFRLIEETLAPLRRLASHGGSTPPSRGSGT